MENFLQQRGMDESEIEHYEGTKLPNESVDLSSFDFFDGEDEEFEDAIFFGDDEDVDAADISIGESNVFSQECNSSRQTKLVVSNKRTWFLCSCYYSPHWVMGVL